MNKLNALSIKNYKRPDILDSYPDIDYEMIPIHDNQNSFIGYPNQIHIDQLSTPTMQNMLKNADHFKIVVKPNPQNHSVLHISNRNRVGSSSTSSIATVLVPLNQLQACKKTKNYTKLILSNGQVFKTAIKFKKIKTSLLQNGFIEHKKRHITIDKVNFHFPNF